jgi:predicted SAM-dependent methyltransferase
MSLTVRDPLSIKSAYLVDSRLMLRKLEIGCGQRPTPGYIHNDLNAFDGVDIVGSPWQIDLLDGSLDEVLALGLIEHLTYAQVRDTFRNVHRMLAPGGAFFFDVPDIPTWCHYVVDHFEGREIPFTIDHVFNTLYGWQRWPGDEHKSGWWQARLEAQLRECGFHELNFGVQLMLDKGLMRNRFMRPHDAHIYCRAVKSAEGALDTAA